MTVYDADRCQAFAEQLVRLFDLVPDNARIFAAKRALRAGPHPHADGVWVKEADGLEWAAAHIPEVLSQILTVYAEHPHLALVDFGDGTRE